MRVCLAADGLHASGLVEQRMALVVINDLAGDMPVIAIIIGLVFIASPCIDNHDNIRRHQRNDTANHLFQNHMRPFRIPRNRRVTITSVAATCKMQGEKLGNEQRNHFESSFGRGCMLGEVE